MSEGFTPVGAQSATRFFIFFQSLWMMWVVKVLPQPGPPVMMTMGERPANTTASCCCALSRKPADQAPAQSAQTQRLAAVV